jgi:hypothetical protein
MDVFERLSSARPREKRSNDRFESEDSDVPSQALNARLIALLLPFWLEGLGDKSCRGEGGDLKTSVIKL